MSSMGALVAAPARDTGVADVSSRRPSGLRGVDGSQRPSGLRDGLAFPVSNLRPGHDFAAIAVAPQAELEARQASQIVAAGGPVQIHARVSPRVQTDLEDPN